MAPLVSAVLSLPIFLKPRGRTTHFELRRRRRPHRKCGGDICSRNRIATSLRDRQAYLPHGSGRRSTLRRCRPRYGCLRRRNGRHCLQHCGVHTDEEVRSLCSLESVFDLLREKSLFEVAAHGVDVVAVCPGYVHTNLHVVQGFTTSNRKSPDSCGAALKMSSRKLSERCVAIAPCVYRVGPTE